MSLLICKKFLGLVTLIWFSKRGKTSSLLTDNCSDKSKASAVFVGKMNGGVVVLVSLILIKWQREMMVLIRD